MAKKQRLGKLVAGAALVIMLSGCSLFNAGSPSIDPPPKDVEQSMLEAIDQGTGQNNQLPTSGHVNHDGVKGMEVQTTLYYKDMNGFVVPVTTGVFVPETQEIVKASLEKMVDGASNELPAGFTGLIPQGTQVNGIQVDENKVATIDFSEAFANYNPQDERKILEAITWTLTSYPNIEQVKLQIEGVDLHEMPVHNLPLTQNWSRAMGINMELSPDTEIGRSMPVTLYFQNHSDDQYVYYIPLTRLVKRSDEVMEVTMDELIRGPLHTTAMSGLLPADAAVLDVALSADESLVTVNFNEKITNEQGKISADALNAIILSLTENTNASDVQITINGDAKVMSDLDISLAQPVSRPVHLNALPM